MDSSQLLTTATLAAKAGGAILREYFETAVERERKADNSFVTEADRRSEEMIVSILGKEFPDYSILGEESGLNDKKSEWAWIIDPLDGTHNFMNAIPIFAISIALMRGDDILLGVVYNPVTHSLFTGVRGRGVMWNNKKTRVSSDTTKSVTVTFGKSPKQEEAVYSNTLFVAYQQYGYKTRHLGSAALELAYLARGGTEGFINCGTRLWDYAAGALLVLEAGGMITDWRGKEWKSSEAYFVASNGKIHNTLLKETTKLRGSF